jgi:hypothetical protein
MQCYRERYCSIVLLLLPTTETEVSNPARFTFTEIEPGVAFEYAVATPGHRRIGRVRRHVIPVWPYPLGGTWIADDGTIQKGDFLTRQAAAEWLASWLSTRGVQ